MTYMTSNKTKRKSIPFQTEIRKARQLSFRILLFLLQSLDGIGSFDGKSVQHQCAHGHALGSACVGIAHHQPASPLPQGDLVPYRLPRELSSGLRWTGATVWTWILLCVVQPEHAKFLGNKIILCRYKAMKVCLGARGQTSHGLTLEESDASENWLTKCLKT